MKKLAGIFCCIVAVLLSAPFGTVPVHAASYDLETCIQILQVLGVDKDIDMDTLQSDAPVTRAAFVNNVATMIDINTVSSNAVYYHDVSKDYWAFNAISALTARGVINGDENSDFRPDEAILQGEAIKILSSLLGYDKYAQANGGYPNGYMMAATQTGLLDGCSNSQQITTSDMYHMLVNALDAPAMVVQYSASGDKYTIDENTTLLGTYRDMYFGYGTLTGGDMVDITASEMLPWGRAVIDGIEYQTELTGLMDQLGCKVNYIYYDNGNDDPSLIWVKAKSSNIVLDLTEKNYSSYNSSANTLTYEDENGKTKTVALNKGFTLVYNGSATSKNIKELLNRDRYTIKLVQTGLSSGYDLAIVWSYDNYFIGSIDRTESIIYDQNDWTKQVSLDENDYEENCCTIIINGTKSNFDTLTEDMVASVYMSEDKRRVTVEAVSLSVSGTISKVFDDSGEYSVMVNDQTYSFYDKDQAGKYSAGNNVTLYLDTKGYIGGVKSGNSENGEFAYIIRAFKDEVDENTFNINLLSSDGSVKNLICSDRTVVDGSRVKIKDLGNVLGEGRNTIRQLVWIRTNADNEIINIDTVQVGDNEDPETTMRVFQEEGNFIYKNIGKLGFKIFVNDQTKIFAIPASPNNATDLDYMVKSKSNLVNDQWYNASAYRVGSSEKEYEEVVVIRGTNWNAASDTDAMVLIEDIQSTLNNDDETVEMIHGFKNGEEVWLTCESDFSSKTYDIGAGDAVRVSYSNNNYVASVEKVYDYSDPQKRIDSNVNANFRVVTAYAAARVGNMLYVGYDSGADVDEVFNLNNIRVLVYDPTQKNQKIIVGDIGDIKTYQMNGNDCSTIVIHTHWGGNPISVIVYPAE